MLPPIFTWIPLPDLPAPPKRFIKQALSVAETGNYDDMLAHRYDRHDEYKHRTVTYKGQTFVSRCQEAVRLGEDFEVWIRQNVFSQYIDASLRINAANHENQTVQGAHVDGRMLKLIWTIEHGGEHAITEFYQKPGLPIVHDVHEGQRMACLDMDELEVIDRARFPDDCWSIHNGMIFHGMTGLSQRRLEFSVSLRPEDLQFSLTSPVAIG